MKRTLALLPLAVLASLALAPAAHAEVKELSYRVGPIEVGPYQVRQAGFDLASIPKPQEDGFVTAMDVDIVDADGTKVPIQRLMLHHIVFANLGTQLGEKHDGTCNRFTLLDSRTTVPGLGERFYGAGEERARLQLPSGYGYHVKGADRWGMTWMLMNHRARTDRAYIEYRITYDTAPDLVPVTPYWLDVRNCRGDPIFSVPGGGRPGSTYSKSSTWRAPEAGRIVAGGGHVHGGARDLVVSQPECGDRQVLRSVPTWGRRDHPFYNVKPILHEPGPIDMSGTLSGQGIPVAAGQELKLTANYDDRLPHTRVMGISVVFMARDDRVTERCGPLPGDVRTFRTSQPGRQVAPRFTVPLIGRDRRGRARVISHPPGRTVRLRGSGRVDVGDRFFARPNVSIPAGARLSWRFGGSELHNVTLANGPRGFASDHLDAGRTFSKRFRVPGTYQVFCGLHPVQMTQSIRVRKRGGRR